MKSFYICAIISSVIFLGCNSTKQISTQKIKKVQKNIKINNQPHWLLNPNQNNKICSVGSAPIVNTKNYEIIATMKAKSNISKQVSIYIKNKLLKKSNCTTKECKKIFEKESTQQSVNMLKDIKTIDNYTDKVNNRYYVRVCTKN